MIHTATTPISSPWSCRHAWRHGHGVRIAILLLGLLGMTALPGTALAQGFCWSPQGVVPTTSVAFNISRTVPITLQRWSTNRTILHDSGGLTPPTLYCTSKNVQNGLVNVPPLPNAKGLFATGIPGIAFRIKLMPGNAHNNGLTAYADPGFTPLPVGSPGNTTGIGGTVSSGPVAGSYVEFNATQARLELVYTGQYLPSGNTSQRLLPSNNATLSGTLGNWQVLICSQVQKGAGGYTCSGNLQPKTLFSFHTGGAVQFTAPTCTLDQNEMTVPLPPVPEGRFGQVGSTAGMTPFAIRLSNCSASLKVSMILHSDDSLNGNQGVMDPQYNDAEGMAKGIGIQLLQSDASTPVKFDQVFQTGTTSATSPSKYDIQLYARYYQTGTDTTAGEVRATAKYTLIYQ